MRISRAENLRFPALSSSAQGKSVPKARPKGVVDGKQVKIPVPAYNRLSVEGRIRVAETGDGYPVEHV